MIYVFFYLIVLKYRYFLKLNLYTYEKPSHPHVTRTGSASPPLRALVGSWPSDDVTLGWPNFAIIFIFFISRKYVSLRHYNYAEMLVLIASYLASHRSTRIKSLPPVRAVLYNPHCFAQQVCTQAHYISYKIIGFNFQIKPKSSHFLSSPL